MCVAKNKKKQFGSNEKLKVLFLCLLRKQKKLFDEKFYFYNL